MWYPARGGLVVQMVSIFWYQNGSFNVSVINLFILLFAAMDSFALSRNFRTHRRDGSPQSLLSSPNTKWRKMKFVKMLSLEQYCTRALSSCHSIISFTPYMLIENSRAGHAVTFFWQPRHAPYGLSHLGPHFRISESHHGVRATASLHHLLSNALLRVCAKSDKDCEKLGNFTSLSHLNVIFCVLNVCSDVARIRVTLLCACISTFAPSRPGPHFEACALGAVVRKHGANAPRSAQCRVLLPCLLCSWRRRGPHPTVGSSERRRTAGWGPRSRGATPRTLHTSRLKQSGGSGFSGWSHFLFSCRSGSEFT